MTKITKYKLSILMITLMKIKLNIIGIDHTEY